MDKMGKKLTDHDLINQVVAWYKLDQSTDQLREAIGLYIKQNTAITPTTSDEPSLPESSSREERTPSYEDADEFRVVSKPQLVSKPQFENGDLKSNVVKYEPQFEPSDELLPARRGRIDVWALYYGTEDFFQRISFGLISMQSLAALFCILVFGAVMFGAWQSNLSSERRKTATFKSMEIEQAERKRTPASLAETEPSPNEDETTEVNATPPELPSTVATSIDAAKPDQIEARPETSATAPESLTATSAAEANTSEPAITPEMATAIPEPVAAAPELVPSAPDPFEVRAKEIDRVLRLMDQKSWTEALAELKVLERSGERELQPLLTMLQIDAKLQIAEKLQKNLRDAASMEEVRKLLMERKHGDYEVHYDLLVARWMLICDDENRRRFLNASALLSESNRERMCAWAQIRNRNKDEKTALTLQSCASQGPSYVCDLLFIASFHYNVSKYDDAYREVIETQQKLAALDTSGKNRVDCWLLKSSKMALAATLEAVAAKRTQGN